MSLIAIVAATAAASLGGGSWDSGVVYSGGDSNCCGSRFGYISSVPYVRNGLLATMRPYPANTVDDCNRPGFNGAVWNSRPIHGTFSPHLQAWPSPGPNAYGAYGSECEVGYALVNSHTVSFNPWVRYTGETLKSYERARQQWLKERGYVGGVRTFVNDAPEYDEENANEQASLPETSIRPRGLPEPRAIIQLAPDAPRAKNKIRVQSTPKMTPTIRVGGVQTYRNDAVQTSRPAANVSPTIRTAQAKASPKTQHQPLVVVSGAVKGQRVAGAPTNGTR